MSSVSAWSFGGCMCELQLLDYDFVWEPCEKVHYGGCKKLMWVFVVGRGVSYVVIQEVSVVQLVGKYLDIVEDVHVGEG